MTVKGIYQLNKWCTFSLQNGDMASALGNCYQIKRLGLQRMSVVIKQHIHKPYSGR